MIFISIFHQCPVLTMFWEILIILNTPDSPRLSTRIDNRVKGIAGSVFFIRFKPISGDKLHILRNVRF